MTCARCGKTMAPDARFCPGCGAPGAAAADTRPSAFHVVGDVMQAVVIPLGPNQEIQAEPGALLYMAGDVEMDSSMKGGLWGGLKRMVGGESLFMTSSSPSQGQVAFAAPHPGKLKQLDLAGGGPGSASATRSFARRPDRDLHRLHQALRRRTVRRRGLHPPELTGQARCSSTRAGT